MKHIGNELAQKLGRLADEMAALRNVPGAEAVCLNKQAELMLLLYGQLDINRPNQRTGVLSESAQREHDAFCLFLEDDLNKFDPAKSAFIGFFLDRMSKREIDVIRSEKPVFRSGGQSEEPPEGEADGKKEPASKKPTVISYDIKAGDDENSATLGDLIPDAAFNDGRQEERMGFNEAILSLITQLLQPDAILSERREYYRLFFTDFIADYLCETQGAEETFRRRERDLFAAVSVSFLDFFLTQKCRSIGELCGAERRKHGEMVEGQPLDEAVGFRMPQDVYITFRKTREESASESAISNHTSNFYRWFGVALCDKAGYEEAMREKLIQKGSVTGKVGRPKKK